MIIQCTKKLLDQLKITAESHPEGDPIFSWHANLLTLNRKKTVVLVNDKNRYVIVLYGLKAKDFKNLNDLIPQAIRKTFMGEGFQNDVIEQYLQQAPSFTYTKTKDKTTVARMNKSIEAVYFYDDLLDMDTILQPALSQRASRYLVTHGKNNYIQANEELYKNLEELTQKPAVQIQAVQLKVTLNLDHHPVWRRLIVPLNYTFYQLHKVLQTAFDWDNSHLHEFYIFNKKKDKRPILNIICHEDALQFDKGIPMKHEQEVKLFSYLPTHKSLTYIYDLGDHWMHDIAVEFVIHDFDQNYPICLEGEGTAPPEDVGGEGGYEYLLEVLEDKNHPDYKEMVAMWNEDKKMEFNQNIVNGDLRGRFG